MRSLHHLQDESEPSVVFFGVNRDLARRHGRTADGAAVDMRSRTARMWPWVRAADAEGYRPVDVGILDADSPQALVEEIIRLTAMLAGAGLRSAVLGCDHTVSYPRLLGLAGEVRPTFVYFDAHLDIAAYGPQAGSLHNGSVVRSLLSGGHVGRAVNVGARAWSSYHPDAVLEGLEVWRTGTAAERAQAAQALSDLPGPLYVSIDADVLDEAFAPDICCPEPFGLVPGELLALCEVLGRRGDILAADASELTGRVGPGAETVIRCLHALFHPKAA